MSAATGGDGRWAGDGRAGIGTAALLALSATAFLGSMLFRSATVLTAPRFWAEEGHVYFQYMAHSSWWDGLTFVYRGNYQLLTNLICSIAAHVPDRRAAFPTTYLPTLVGIYCCFLLAEALRSRGASVTTIAGAVVLFSLQHAGYEVFLNATNVMWVCSAGTLFVALGHDHPPKGVRAWVAYGSIAAFGLTGVTSVALAPVYAVQLLRRRTAYRAALLLILCCAAAVQAVVVVRHGVDGGRSMALTPHMVVPFVLQTELASFLPPEALDAVGARIAAYDAAGVAMAVQIGLVGLALLGLFHGMASRATSAVDAALIVGAMVWVSAFNEFGSLGPAIARHSGWDGGRYYFLGNTCFIALVCLSRGAETAFQRRVAACAMALMLADAAAQPRGSDWVKLFVAGPSVSSQVRACAGERPCRISYPPHGPGAEFMMDHTFVPDYALPE